MVNRCFVKKIIPNDFANDIREAALKQRPLETTQKRRKEEGDRVTHLLNRDLITAQEAAIRVFHSVTYEVANFQGNDLQLLW